MKTGFYVVGRYGQSVAWYATRTEAERAAKQFNYRGGCVYRVIADSPAPAPPLDARPL